MTNAFKTLVEFLDSAEAEVEGRALPEPPEAVKVKLRHFARGTLPPGDREELLDQLSQNRQWLAVLAQEVRALRSRPPAGQEMS